MEATGTDNPTDHRANILVAAASLLDEGGIDALTTRAVAARAGTQGPTIYRLFGDKKGLVEAVAEHVLRTYVTEKTAREAPADGVSALRDGWDAHVAFGLAHPAIYRLMNADRHGAISVIAEGGYAVLRDLMRKIAREGRLRVSEERAVDLMRAAASGIVMILIDKAPVEREGLSDAAREAILTAILTDASPMPRNGAAGAATTLRGQLDDVTALSPGERHLLDELLRRIAER
ncbi:MULTISPECIES: TetR/AcrR family transcriptional regulator [Sphingobium]|uniref:HTH tetR-type domain-containing protein n=3 Tax=Sphingobium TaxID=165695 RepID=T0IMK7_9SPHN|nr:TetR family transcriptional regulator [Sphingobium fuliginis]EQB10834.1 hypothetical protein RLDS_25700 [Sphingobium lactosutens DS20]QDC36531.1 TetR/AcrR family transcriptional regulator [Sphingobium fuliginis ATCC 27551]